MPEGSEWYQIDPKLLKGNSSSFRTNLVSFRTFRHPLFSKPIGWDFFCHFLQQDDHQSAVYCDCLSCLAHAREETKWSGPNIFNQSYIWKPLQINFQDKLETPKTLKFVWKSCKIGYCAVFCPGYGEGSKSKRQNNGGLMKNVVFSKKEKDKAN